MKDKKVLITGGAGGLGQDLVRTFARQGMHVLVLDTNADAAEELVAAVNNNYTIPGSAEFVCCDLLDTEATRATAKQLLKQHSAIDVLVNNAAIYPSKPALEFDFEEYRAVQTVNVDSGVLLARELAPGMIANGWGRIVNITSITFYGGWERLMPYVVSKGALVGLTRSLAREFGKHGITVNAASPGAFPTDAEKIHPDPEGYQQFVLDHQSLKRRGTPQDFANVVSFLCSEQSAFVTGQVLNVDGGWVMH